MIPAPFRYRRVHSVEEARTELQAGGDDAKVIAGGMSLIPLMKTRLAQPTTLVDIGEIDQLRYVREDAAEICVGATTSHSQLSTDPVIRERLPLLADIANEVGDAQVRARGTIGGVLAHADSAGDYCTLASMLDAVVVTTSRCIPAREFLIDFMTTPLEADELITEIRFPIQPGAHSYTKFRRRRTDWAIVGVGVQESSSGYRIGLTNVGSTAVRGLVAEEALRDGSTIEEAASALAESINPVADASGGTEYKRSLVKVLLERSLTAVGAR